MSKRAEEAALKAYPVGIVGYTTKCEIGAEPELQDWNEEKRRCFQEGYEQAEKDLALTWMDVADIVILADTIKDGHEEEWRKLVVEAYYTAVLKAYNDAKH